MIEHLFGVGAGQRGQGAHYSESNVFIVMLLPRRGSKMQQVVLNLDNKEVL